MVAGSLTRAPGCRPPAGSAGGGSETNTATIRKECLNAGVFVNKNRNFSLLVLFYVDLENVHISMHQL